MNTIALILKAETEGLDDFDEYIDYAVALVTTGLVHSTGSAGRFVASVDAEYPDEFRARLAEARA